MAAIRKASWILVPLALALGLNALAFASQEPSSDYQQHRFDVRSFGATGDGSTLDTQAIQRAIRAASRAGGGIVLFHPGTYLAGTFELLSNVTLDIEAGAVLKASANIADYRPIKDFGFGRNYGVDLTGEGFLMGLIVAKNVENIAIVGQGAIDGSGGDFFDFTKPHYTMDFDPKATRQGQAFMDAVLNTTDGPVAEKTTGRPGTLLVIFNCKNLLLRDITVRNAPNWTIHISNAQSSVIEGIHILNDPRIPNNDGIDCFNCRNMQIADSDIRTGDDDFAIVGGEDITVSNCTLFSNSSAIRLENTRYSLFSNLVIHANRGLAIYERGAGVTSDIQFSDIVIETHLLTGHWWGKGEPIYLAAGTSGGKGGTIRDITFTNVGGEAENGTVLYGAPGATVENIAFHQIAFRFRVTRPEVNAVVGGNFDFRWTAESVHDGVFQHDIPALYARYVHGLKLEGFQVSWADAMPAWYSSALELENISKIQIDRFGGRQAGAFSSSPVIAAKHVSDISITNSRADHGATTFFSASDVRGERLFTGNDLRDTRQAFDSATSFVMGENILPSPASQ